MPPVTCPECLAKFESSGARGTSCPTCGHRLGSARRPDDAPRRSFRRDDEEYDDRRPARRPRREKSTAADSLVPLLILGGALFVVLVVGGVGFLVYRVAQNAPSRSRDVAEVQPVAVGPMEFAPTAPRDDGLPGVNPADLAPGGPPAFGPPPSFPQPGGQPMPGIDPRQVQPPGMPQPGGPPGFAPRPGGPRGPGRPATPQPPAMPQPPGAAATVTLSNFRRGGGDGVALTVDYEYTAGALQPAFDRLCVRTEDGVDEVRLLGLPPRKGTVRLRQIGLGNLQGEVEVWMERRSATTLPGARGQTTSNTLKVGASGAPRTVPRPLVPPKTPGPGRAKPPTAADQVKIVLSNPRPADFRGKKNSLIEMDFEVTEGVIDQRRDKIVLRSNGSLSSETISPEAAKKEKGTFQFWSTEAGSYPIGLDIWIERHEQSLWQGESRPISNTITTK